MAMADLSPRQRWKLWYRQYRIIRRETSKATLDMMIFGTGYVFISADDIHHVPIQEVILDGTHG